MTHKTDKQETYREQLARLAQSLASAHPAHVCGDLATGSAAERVKEFVDGNRDKRFEKLQRQVDFIAPAFESIDELLEAYIRREALAAYDTGASDGERFLNWLERTQELTPEQCDFLACQRARHAIEDAARHNRRGHVRFQELWSAAEALLPELESNRKLRVVANPIRVWSRFQTQVLLDESAHTPADLVFFPVGTNIHTAVLERDAIERVRELVALGPCTLDEWVMVLESFTRPYQARRSELATLCHDLARIGLVAFQ